MVLGEGPKSISEVYDGRLIWLTPTGVLKTFLIYVFIYLVNGEGGEGRFKKNKVKRIELFMVVTEDLKTVDKIRRGL